MYIRSRATGEFFVDNLSKKEWFFQEFPFYRSLILLISETNSDELRVLLRGGGFSLFAVTETWMKSSTTLTSVSIPGYNFFYNNRPKFRGGGVGLFIRKEYKSSVIIKSTFKDDKPQLEYLLVKVTIYNKETLVLVFYRPPDANITESIDTLTDLINDHSVDFSSVILLGDLNIDSLKPNSNFKKFNYNLSCLNLMHLPFEYSRRDKRTDHRSLIDHIFISKTLKSVDFTNTGISFSDHDALLLALNIPKPQVIPEIRSFRDYENIDVAKLHKDLNDINWYYILDCPDLDEKAQRFTNIMCHLQDKHSPIKTVRVPDPKTPWLTPYIKKLQAEREIAYVLWRNRRVRRKGDELWIAYTKIRNKVNNAIDEAKGKRLKKKFDANLPPKTLYANLRREGVIDESNIELFELPNLNELNNHYRNVASKIPFNPNSNYDPHPNLPTNTQFHFRGVSQLEVFEAYSSIKSNAVGSDGLSRKFLKHVIPIILPVITDIINCCLTSSSFPAVWKLSLIRPLPKVTNPKTLTDFRPISVLPFSSKILEILMLKQMQHYFNSYSLFPTHQSGFRKGHSTETALLKLTSDISRGSGYGKCTVLVSLDFSKAYDCVPHTNLVKKLSSTYSFSNSSSKLISNYLQNRSQMVIDNNGNLSDILRVFRGMPQGGNLCCLLFAGYLDLPSILNCNYCAFADDIQIYASGLQKDMSNTVELLNENLSKIMNWCNSNGLALNPTKTRAIPFQPSPNFENFPKVAIGVTEIPYSDSLDILGVTLKFNLSWDPQVAKISKRIFFLLHNLYRFKHYLSVDLKTRLFKQLILPHLLYASTVYSASLSGLNQRTLSRALRSAVRFVFDRGKRDSISPFVIKLLSLPFEKLLAQRRLIMLFKILRFHHYPKYLKSLLERGTSLRTSLLQNLTATSSWSQRCPIQKSISDWNKLSWIHRRCSDVNRFKKITHSYFLDD